MPASEPADQQHAWAATAAQHDLLSDVSFHPPDLVQISPLVHTNLELCRRGNLGNIVSSLVDTLSVYYSV